MRPEHALAWARGWTVSRGTPPPVAVPGGWRIKVGLPNHTVRYVLPAYVPELVEQAHAQGTWVKICDRAQLDSRWTVEPLEYLMTRHLYSADRVQAPPEYTLRVSDGPVTRVAVEHAGVTAARGQLGLAGEFAVVDQVVTEPAHRRRGLATVVMLALADAAVRQGAHTGVLVATEDGRALYSSLGWSLVAPVTSAWISREQPARAGATVNPG